VTTGKTYRVVVTRDEDGYWLADVPELEGSHTDASNLTALDRYVRELIVLGADLPDEAMDDLSIEYAYQTPDDRVAEAAELRREREELARREAQLQERTRQLARALTASGYSARDTGPLLGISHQRVSQVQATVTLLRPTKATTKPSAPVKSAADRASVKTATKRAPVKSAAAAKAGGRRAAVAKAHKRAAAAKAVPRKVAKQAAERAATGKAAKRATRAEAGA
jgi:hypothetical protein